MRNIIPAILDHYAREDAMASPAMAAVLEGLKFRFRTEYPGVMSVLTTVFETIGNPALPALESTVLSLVEVCLCPLLVNISGNISCNSPL